MRLFGLALMGFGIIVFYFKVASILYDVVRYQYWQPISATLIKAEVEKYQIEGEYGDMRLHYKPDVQYEYQLDNITYNSDLNTANFVESTSSKIADDFVNGLIAEQKENGNITIWYATYDPAQSAVDISTYTEQVPFMLVIALILWFSGRALRKLGYAIKQGPDVEESVTFYRQSRWVHQNILSKLIDSGKFNIEHVDGQILINTPGPVISLLACVFTAPLLLIAIVIAVDGPLLLALLIFLTAISITGYSIYWWGRNCLIKVSEQGITVDVYFFSKKVKQLEFDRNSIKKLSAKWSSKKRKQGVTIESKYRMRLHSTQGKVFELGGGFPSKAIAESTIDEIEALIF